jgi:pimeloyl-ACP methyl ester carboxylesterase
MSAVPRVLFLPGAGGASEFWRPVAEHLPRSWEKVHFSWPGLGDQPHDSSVQGLDDLVARVEGALERPSDLVAQSMCGVVAIRVAVRQPERVRRLVLVATSGGVDMGRFGGVDWREDYRQTYPRAAGWISEEQSDLTGMITRITAPTLLLWGDEDSTSPVAVGEELEALLPNAILHVIAGGTHSFAHDRSRAVARLIAAHLAP